MRRFSLFAVSFIFAAIAAGSAFGQTPATTQAPFKLAVINTDAFAATTGGLTRYIAARKQLADEFRPLETELQGMVTKYNALGAEIKKLQDQSATVPIDPKTAQAKVEEYQNLELAIKRKEEDGKTRAARREPQVMGPILAEIEKALDDYAKSKGYALILDAAKLANAGIILAYDAPKVDVTKDFITYFNARPATTASTATPR